MASLSEHITQWVRSGFSSAIDDRRDELAQVAQAGGNQVNEGIAGSFGGSGGALGVLIPALEVLGGPITSAIGLFTQAAGRAGNFVLGIAEGWTLGGALIELTRPMVIEAVHAVAAAIQSEIYDPETAARLEARGLIDNAFGRSEAAGGNLSGEHYDRLVNAAMVQPGIGELLEMYRRGVASDADWAYATERQAIDPGFHDKLKALARVPPGAADLALANLRGELDDATMIQLAGELGVDEFTIRLLVGNTGEPPGLQELLAARRRGFIDDPRLERGIRQSRIRNEWIDVIEQLEHYPMSVAQAVEAHVQGHITEAESRAKADQNGLEADDWQALYDTAGQPLSRTEMATLRHRGIIGDQEVEQAARESRLKDKYVKYIKQLDRRLIPYRTINVIIEKGIRDHQWGVDYLMSIGYNQDDAEALIATSQSSKTTKHKDITEAQILELYRARGITRKDAVELLAGIGYQAHEADLIIEVADTQVALSEQHRAVTATRAMFLGARITKGQASGQLDRLGVLATQRDELLKDWELEKSASVRTLSPAQVASAVFYGVWSNDEGVRKLESLGYSEQDARIIIVERLKTIPKDWHIGPPQAVGT